MRWGVTDCLNLNLGGQVVICPKLGGQLPTLSTRRAAPRHLRPCHALVAWNIFIFLYRDFLVILIELGAWGLDATNSQWNITISVKIYLLFHQFQYFIHIRKIKKYTRSYYALSYGDFHLVARRAHLCEPITWLNKRTTSVIHTLCLIYYTPKM